MRVEDLHRKELLELDPEGGVIRFAGQRALLFDAVAMGIFWLVSHIGLLVAFVIGAGAWYSGQLLHFCKQCRVYGCPFNRVPLSRHPSSA